MPKTTTYPVLPIPSRAKNARPLTTTATLVAEVVKNVSLRIVGEYDGLHRPSTWFLYVPDDSKVGGRADHLIQMIFDRWLSSLLPAQQHEGGLLLSGLGMRADDGVFRDWCEENGIPDPSLARFLRARCNFECDRLPYDRAWLIGDDAEFRFYNLCYYGPIVKIGKVVEIDDGMDRDKRHRLDLWTFWSRNKDFDAMKAAKHNSEWTD